jgi:hypothetical protein
VPHCPTLKATHPVLKENVGSFEELKKDFV